MRRPVFSDKQAIRPLIVDLARHFGGAEVRVINTARALGPDGCYVACLEGSALARKLDEMGGVKLLLLGSSKLDPWLGFRLRKAAALTHCNLIDAHNILSIFWTRLAFLNRAARPAILATVHSSIRVEQKSWLKGRLYERLQKWALPGFDHVTTVAGYLCKELAETGLAERNITVIPNGTALAPANSGDRLSVREEFGLDPAAPVIGTTARLEPAKGIDLLLLAFEQVLRKHPEAKCLIAGDGRMMEELKDYTKNHGLQEAVIFTGFRSDIPRILSALDLFVLSSRTEGIPFSLLEACAAGLPVIATRVGGVPDVIRDGQTGRLVDPRNVQQMAQAVDELLSNPSAAAVLGERARKDIAERFSQEGMIAATRQVYQSAIDGRKAGRA